jgi:protein-tyrosine phosphatase
VFEVLTVCTGNICRSPLAEQLLRTRLRPLAGVVSSAGTRGLPAAPMTPESARLAGALGIDPAEAAQHRSRFLDERMLRSPDLVLTMTRDHRREVAELAPARLRSTFTVREFARLTAQLSDAQIVDAADAEAEPGARIRAVSAAAASLRGLSLPPADPSDDDVVDPYGRSWQTYELSAAQLVPAVDEVVRVLRLAVAPR